MLSGHTTSTLCLVLNAKERGHAKKAADSVEMVSIDSIEERENFTLLLSGSTLLQQVTLTQLENGSLPKMQNQDHRSQGRHQMHQVHIREVSQMRGDQETSVPLA